MAMANSSFNIDELHTDAAINAAGWLDAAISNVDGYMDGTEEAKAVAVAGYLVACALSYHADRMVDAAEVVAAAIRDALAVRGQ